MAAEDLERRIAALERELAKRSRRIENLERENARLRKIIEELKRANKRQAAPFGVDAPKANPKRRGRKSGKEYGRRGERTRPERVDRVVHVGVPLWCPTCEGRVRLHHTDTQWQTDIPPVTPVTTEFRIDVGRCLRCNVACEAGILNRSRELRARLRCKSGRD